MELFFTKTKISFILNMKKMIRPSRNYKNVKGILKSIIFVPFTKSLSWKKKFIKIQKIL